LYTYTEYQAAADHIRKHLPLEPKVGLILGSGLGMLADETEGAVHIPYAEVPGWPVGTVQGHAARLVAGRLHGQPALIMQGRAHFYEGHSMMAITFPIRVMAQLGIQTLILTNAAGGLNPSYNAGDLMVIKDHIGLPALAGQSPLVGPNDDRIGPRFPSMTNIYDRSLRQIALKIAEQQGIPIHQGVYVNVSGPAFESPAEIRMLRGWGADAVGMSTVPEAIVARHAGLRVAGFSAITNATIDDVDAEKDVNHEEVLEVGRLITPRLAAILRGVLQEL
jgi:purine-nucleoside phosphorylase